VRALDDWAASEPASIDSFDWSSDMQPPAPVARAASARRASEHEAPAPTEWSPAPAGWSPAPAEWSPATAESSPAGGVAGRRTVTIRGQVADRYVPARQTSRRRPERRYERSGFRPDRAALWAFVLGVMLILAAVTSAHAATLHAVAHLH
jgi:hypothetical protein